MFQAPRAVDVDPHEDEQQMDEILGLSLGSDPHVAHAIDAMNAPTALPDGSAPSNSTEKPVAARMHAYSSEKTSSTAANHIGPVSEST